MPAPVVSDHAPKKRFYWPPSEKELRSNRLPTDLGARMANFETAINFSGPDDKNVVLKFTLTENDGAEDEVAVEVTHGGNRLGAANWRLNYQAKTLTLDLASTMTSGQAICLVTCLGGSIGATLVDCLAQAKQRSAVRLCLQKHAPGALISAVSCVFGCLSV
jgi:hypothetical protein